MADTLAQFIQEENPDYFYALEKMVSLGLGEDGRYYVYWDMHAHSSIAEQINALELTEQGFFVNPDVVYWGQFLNPKTQDYTLVLILDNPLFQRTEAYLED